MSAEKKNTVLIVEDNEQNLELLKIYMEDLPDVEVITAGNGVEALEQIEEYGPDITVVMVTALNETSDIERAAKCGTDDYLSKPIDRKAMVNLVKSLLSKE
jgi:two-component system chemotaxis response regulator CheY